MNRLDRLFAIATYLQGRERVRAADLAAAFEVSVRTIYRDLGALSEAGVPVVALPGQGYALAEGFFLPPLLFTTAEATALALGARLLASQASGVVPAAGEAAVAKIAAILPEGARREVERLTGVVRFVVPTLPPRRADLDDPRLGRLQEAIHERRVVRLRYHSRTREETTEREVEPSALAFLGGVWYLSGWCRLRAGARDFRFDRIEEMVVLPETFAARDAVRTPPAPVTVRVRFDERTARWVRERQHWSFRREEPSPDGPVMVYEPDRLDEIAGWLLGWGAAAEPLDPPELRAMLLAEARAIVEGLEWTPSGERTDGAVLASV